MSDVQRSLGEMATRKGGVLTREELLAAGVSRGMIRRQVAAGAWKRMERNVYVPKVTADRVRGDLAGRHELMAAATLAKLRAEGAVSHTSAAVIHGMRVVDDPEVVTITRPPRFQRASGARGVRIHTAELPDRHTTRVRGLTVTTPARTVVDVARRLDFMPALVVADSALRLRLTDKEELREMLAWCRGWPGVRKAARVLEHASPKAASALESMGRARFIESDLPRPEIGVWLYENLPRPRQPDFLWEGQRVIGEADGLTKYTTDPTRIAKERTRDEELREAGYEVVHFLWHELRHTPAKVLTRIHRAFTRTHHLGYW